MLYQLVPRHPRTRPTMGGHPSKLKFSCTWDLQWQMITPWIARSTHGCGPLQFQSIRLNTKLNSYMDWRCKSSLSTVCPGPMSSSQTDGYYLERSYYQCRSPEAGEYVGYGSHDYLHAIRMSEEWLPWDLLFSERNEGSRPRGRPLLHFKDM